MFLAIARRFIVVDRAARSPYCSREMNASIVTSRSRGIWHAVASAALCLAVWAASGVARAQHITVDGRLSPAQTLVGPNYAIGANLGKQVGGNLFQSFGLFSLTQPETATFSGPATVTNIIGRVTGGTASSINGTIKSTIPGANLYLINPSGVVFGPNGTVNVSGSFHASTADYLRMSDGARFQATNPDGSTLSAAPPAAFGFLNATPGTITVNGSTLAVPMGQTLGLVGGPVTINNGATLTAPSGTIHVTSAAGAGEVPVAPTNTSALTVATLGPVSIAGTSTLGSSTLDVSDFINKTSGGSIFIRSGTLTIANGFLDGTNYGTGPGGQISLLGTSQIVLSNGAAVHAPAIGSGSGASVALTTGPAGSISASGDSLVEVCSASCGLGGGSSGGLPGPLAVTTGTLTLTGGAIFGSDAQGSGNAGPISIAAGSIMLDGRAPASSAALTGISSFTVAGSASAADITINTGTLTILANGEITSSSFGIGNGGQVSVAATGALSIDATSARFSTGVGTLSGLNTQLAGVTQGNAGDMTIKAASLSIVGSPGPLSPPTFANVVGAEPFSGLSTQTSSSGKGGSITLNVGSTPLVMSGGAVISSSTSGTGQGGILNVAAQGPLLMSGAGTAITAAALPGANGNAGSIAVGAGSLTVQGGAQIASSTAGPGTGGDVVVAVASNILLSGPGPQITARSTGSGNAGSVMLSALNLTENGGAAISTEASTANGGNIALAVTDFLYLVDSQITTSVKGSIGNGGNILIDPQLMVLDRSQIIAQAVLGHGGNITISVNDFFPSADSLVSASSALGISGTVEIIGPRVDLDGSLVVLPSELRNAAAIFRDSCAARGNRPRSSLTEAGRGGLPQDPETTLLALHIADRNFVPGPHAAAGRHDEAIDPALTAVRVKMHCG
jgi:filamentous hemagglutinin family protein